MCLNLSKTCGILYRIRYNFTTETLCSWYYSLCYPYLIYCLPIWGYTWPTVVNGVFVAQKETLRAITFKSKYDSTDILFKDINILKFDLFDEIFQNVDHI